MSKKSKWEKKAKASKFPETLYIIKKNPGTVDEFYNVYETLDNISGGNGTLIAGYRYETIQQLKVIPNEVVPLYKPGDKDGQND